MDNNKTQPFCRHSDFNKKSFIEQLEFVYTSARDLISRVSPRYDLESCYVEKQSFHPDDWYLWTAAVKDSTDGKYTVWTLNLTTGTLQIGRYALAPRDAIRAMNNKRG